jgi:hypothetical protein
VSPNQTRLKLGEGKQFNARLKGRKGTVVWSVEGLDTGTISPTGFFQAPSSAITPASIRIRARVKEDSKLRAEAVVLLDPVNLDVRPKEVSLSTSDKTQLAAKVAGTADQRVRWQVEGGDRAGRITDSGLYTAPDSFPTPGTVMVRAISMADPSKSAAATIRIGAVSIEVSPNDARLRLGESRRFTARVKGSQNPQVIWKVVGNDQGEISNAGLYTTPSTLPTPAVVLIEAAAAADPTKKAGARIQIEAVQIDNGAQRRGRPRPSALNRMARGIYRMATPSVVRLLMPFDPVDLIVPGPRFRGKSGKQYVPLGGGIALEAAVGNTTNDRIRWTIEGSPVGEVNEDGFYQAPPSATTPHVVQVRASSIADPTKSILYTVTIPPVVVQPEEKGRKYLCPLNGAVQLAARAENTENNRLLWSVEGGEEYGRVSPTGLYQTPSRLSTPTIVQVRAASEADPTKYVLIPVQVPAVGVEVSPGSTEVRAGGSVRLKARARGFASQKGAPDVVWRLTPEVGSITDDGVYTAPSDGGPQIVQATAVLRSDPTKTGSCTLRLRGGKSGAG